MQNSLKNNNCSNGNIIPVNGNDYTCIQQNVKMSSSNENNNSHSSSSSRNLQRHLPNFLVLFVILSIMHLKLHIINAEPTVDLPTRCESCVLFAREFEEQIRNDRNIKVSTTERELKFLEALEDICERMLQYKLHKEKSGISRFAKEESTTMKALNELRNKGVKVELGMPYEMWDSPSVEIVALKQNCETLLEQYEDDLEQWYHSQDRPMLEKYLCEKRALKQTERDCLHTFDYSEL